VLLANGATLCHVSLWEPPVATKPKPRETNDVKKLSPFEYQLDRGFVDRIIESSGEMLAGTATAFEKHNGRPVGIRLARVKDGSVLQSIGLQAGDVIRSINGYEVGDPEQAFTAFAHLRTAPRLKVVLTRGGKPVEIDYVIR
jgi:general secretion pathway protein C